MGLVQSHPQFFKLPSFDESAQTAELTKIFGNDYRKLLEDSLITHVSLYRTSHPQSVQIAPRTPENFHSFVLLTTDRGVFLSLEKHENEIYIGKCNSRESLVDGRVNSDVPHATPPYIVVEDESTSKLVDFIESLSTAQYWWFPKCQMFAKTVFMKLAQSQHEDFFKMTPDCGVTEKLFGSFKHIHDLKNACVTHVAVFKTPLEGIYRKSNESLREAIGRQWTSVDYHAFVVMTTSFGICLSLEKQQDGIYIGRSPWYENLVHYMMENSPRKSPVDLVIEDDSDYSLSRLMVLIEDEKSGYSATDDNCQHFAKRIFDKVALNKTWEFTRPYKFFCKLMALFFLTVILFNSGPYVFFTLLCWVQSFVHCFAHLIYLLFCFCCNAVENLLYLFRLILGLSILVLMVHYLVLDYLRNYVRLTRGMERCLYLAILILCILLQYPWVNKAANDANF